MKRLLQVLATFLSRLVSQDLISRILKGIESAGPYLQTACAFARTAAAMTPTRTDNQLIALADELGVPALLEPGLDRGVAIARIVFRALKTKFPEIADRVLNRAIEIAYGAIKP